MIPLICSANQFTGFYIIGTIVVKELIITPTSLTHFMPLVSFYTPLKTENLQVFFIFRWYRN